MVSYDEIRAIASNLPASFEQASYGGQPSWRTKPRMFAWIRLEPEALVVWVESLEEKEALIQSEPDKFFTTSHYDGNPLVLVRLEAVNKAEAAELIIDSYRHRSTKKLVAELEAQLAAEG